MTADRPSPEQQLADVMANPLSTHRRGNPNMAGHDLKDMERALSIAAAIVAAVNTGDIDPIVPGGKCVCGEPRTLGVVHRLDGPCFHYDKDELAELRALKARVDGLVPYPAAIVGNDHLWFNTAADLLAWLRGDSDGS